MRDTNITTVQVARPVDIIWNVTYVCPWKCAICCVDAKHVTRRGDLITITSESLTRSETIPFVAGRGSQYDQALSFLQAGGRELTLDQKLQVLDHLDGFAPKLDFSGGDVLTVAENFELLRAASARFGRNRITLTATGAGLHGLDPAEVGLHIGELNFTYDSDTTEGNDCRPAGYASGNLKRAAEFARMNIATRAECPLSTSNVDDATLRQIYANLADRGIDQLLLMRLFPVGRGTFHSSDVPTPAQYRRAISVLREAEARRGGPRVKLECALKFFDQPTLAENPCDLLSESFGLMADGTLLASPWAINARGGPLHDAWVLGNLVSTPMNEILASEKARALAGRLDENFGHCKIFAFLNSRRRDPVERMLDTADPLYAGVLV